MGRGSALQGQFDWITRRGTDQKSARFKTGHKALARSLTRTLAFASLMALRSAHSLNIRLTIQDLKTFD